MRAAALLALLLFAGPAVAQPRSGYWDAGPQVRAMQDDDTANPGFLWVEQGRAAWQAPPPGGKACAGCHGDIAAMRGVAARYPAADPASGAPVDLAGRINLCRAVNQSAPKLAREGAEMLALAAAIGVESRGLPQRIATDGPMASVIARGEALFRTRMGQLNLSCAQCHEARAGARLGGAVIPEGHANAYPEYRLEWQTIGSLARRIRACLTGVRAEPFAADAPEMLELEAWLALRGAGLPMETPGVRP